MSEISDDEVKENLQVVSITVNFGVQDVLRLRPDWSVESCEHFIDSVYQDLSAELREAGDDFMLRVIQKTEETEREEKN